ncbi:MAG: DUF1559 domain-containing protein, partial [Planctomycetia bacterium]|nr:DUF1559 domain-containing protein [Planctomycetia bacterium]
SPSWMFRVFPYIEQKQAYEILVSGRRADGGSPWVCILNRVIDQAGGYTSIQKVMRTKFTAFCCPSQPKNDLLPSIEAQPEWARYRYNYAACFGPNSYHTAEIHQSRNDLPLEDLVWPETGEVQHRYPADSAPMGWNKIPGLSRITDGTSNTALYSEVVLAKDPNSTRYADTMLSIGAGFTAYYPPNSNGPDVINVCWSSRGLASSKTALCIGTSAPLNHLGQRMTARSFHSGGVNCALADASVRFVSDSVDLHIWRSMSTANGGETISLP